MEELINKDTKWIWLSDRKFKVNHWVEFRQTVNVGHPKELACGCSLVKIVILNVFEFLEGV